MIDLSCFWKYIIEHLTYLFMRYFTFESEFGITQIALKYILILWNNRRDKLVAFSGEEISKQEMGAEKQQSPRNTHQEARW